MADQSQKPAAVCTFFGAIVSVDSSTSRPFPTPAGARPSEMIDMTARIHHRRTVTGLISEYRRVPSRPANAQLSNGTVDQVPKTMLLDTVVPILGALLAEHNARNPAWRLRLRVVVHAGEVTFDDNGCFGEALDVASSPRREMADMTR